jgi:hypothetical protein
MWPQSAKSLLGDIFPVGKPTFLTIFRVKYSKKNMIFLLKSDLISYNIRQILTRKGEKEEEEDWKGKPENFRKI